MKSYLFAIIMALGLISAPTFADNILEKTHTGTFHDDNPGIDLEPIIGAAIGGAIGGGTGTIIAAAGGALIGDVVDDDEIDLGTMIGAGIGGAVAGPAGAALGAFLGDIVTNHVTVHMH